jgi:hypothetical protein
LFIRRRRREEGAYGVNIGRDYLLDGNEWKEDKVQFLIESMDILFEL